MARQSQETSGMQPYGQLHAAFYQQDLRTNQVVIEYNSHEKQPAASLSKLFIVAVALKVIEDERLSLQERYHIDPDEYQENMHGTGKLKAELLPWVVLSRTLRRNMLPTKTLEDLLRYSIQFSDNLAIAKVANVVGRDRIQDILSGWKFYDTTILNPGVGTPNNTTAENVGQFLHDFGHGFLVKDNYLAQKFLRWIPTRKSVTASGREITIRYKTGNITQDGFSFCHQAGYLQSVDHRFIDHSFVILTRDRAVSDKDSTYPQQERVRSFVEDLAYQLN